MASESSCNYWVFREGRNTLPGESVLRQVVGSLAELRHANHDRTVNALIRAGELETALADAGSSDAPAAAGITNAVAALLVGVWSSDLAFETLADIAAQLKVPEQVQISTAEGFAYYALHPLAFAELIDKADLRSSRAAVLGIRSIGATLSAVVTATLARRNIRAQRITVRPEGHPYDRRTQFSDSQVRWIAAHRSNNAEFFVVDEGPGLSGSSFLSVGEALLQAGVERRRIRFLCSRGADPESLVASDAAQRWRSFDSQWPTELKQIPESAAVYMGGGRWREWKYASEAEWPASWAYMERAKYLSADCKRLFKFIGLGHFGAPVEQRARILARTGFSPQLIATDHGYGEYAVIDGRPAHRRDLTRAVLDRIADYCSMRAVEFRFSGGDVEKLEETTRFNYEMEVGERPNGLHLEAKDIVIADGRMLPHEWVFGADGTLFKTDGEIHGDDHFFPGATDIAWDLAGAIVEWEMDRDGRDYLLQRFAGATGDKVQRRIDSYVLAYATFRLGMSMMGAHSLRDTPEEGRLRAAATAYRRILNGWRARASEPPVWPRRAVNPAPAA